MFQAARSTAPIKDSGTNLLVDFSNGAKNAKPTSIHCLVRTGQRMYAIVRCTGVLSHKGRRFCSSPRTYKLWWNHLIHGHHTLTNKYMQACMHACIMGSYVERCFARSLVNFAKRGSCPEFRNASSLSITKFSPLICINVNQSVESDAGQTESYLLTVNQ